tara:strand:- start:2265 stop:2465 length:201 start_codon:yes stop_codon:yes gene_type:complete
MAGKSTHNIENPKSMGKSSLETRSKMGSTEIDVGGPKHSYWQSFMPKGKSFAPKKLDTLMSQKKYK